MRLLVRNVLILALLSGLLFVLLEAGVRQLAPQEGRMEMVAGESLGVMDPVLGHRLRPGAVAVDHSSEFVAHYTINEQGLRDTVVYEASRKEGRKRFLLLGDSFTFGLGNDYDHIWPVLVERMLAARGRRIELVKAGVPGFDTRLEVLYLNEMFAQTTPDAVVLGFLPNDLFTNNPLSAGHGETESAAPAVVAADEKAASLQVVILFARLLMSSDRLYSFLYQATPRRQYFEDSPTPELQAQLATTSGLLREAARFCRERGVPLVVLSIPQQFQVLVEGRGYSHEGLNMHYIDRELGQLAAREGFHWIPALDALASAYREQPEDLYFRLDGHLNERGNRLVAEYFTGQLDSLVQRWAGPAPLH